MNLALADFDVPPAWLAGVVDLTRALGAEHPSRRSTRGAADQFLYERVDVRRCMTGGIYLHEWQAGDPRDLHDHPWDCVSLVLEIGYYEVTADGRRWCPPGDVIFQRAEELHRIELDPGKPRPRSLFVTSIARREHGFQTEAGWICSKEYLRMLRDNGGVRS